MIALLLLATGITIGLALVPRAIYPSLANEQLQGISDPLVRLQLKNARSALEIEFRWQLIAVTGIFLGTGVIGSWVRHKK
ncbi:hypothetical protein AB0395_21125 [Streptosporangium sp. NPDC051023]|uniref:hypothetical protein n=1 Tax=Streptosporangium sp. NPDC051023 TaxID=3155410 RepID=UPI00344FBACE